MCLHKCKLEEKVSEKWEIAHETFYVIVKNFVSTTNHEGNTGTMKTVLMRFDGIENSIFLLFPFF